MTLALDQPVILGRHLLPNVLTPVIILATLRVASVIVWESGLSFLGLSVPPPTPTWGRMLSEGRAYLANACGRRPPGARHRVSR
jgi:peptide/nickel transport system permease protein